MNQETVMGIIRHVLTFGGGFLVTKGVVGEADLQIGIGAIISLIGLAWSVWAKRAA